MAVDANVIIFARVREEVTTGISVKTSLKNGFHKQLSAIVDGNVTTLIASSGSVVQRFRNSKRIRTDTGNRYCGIHVYRTGDHTYDRICILWNRNPQRESVLSSDERKKAGEFPRKEEDILQRFHCTDPCRICIMGVNSAKGNGALAYSLDFQGGTSMNVKFDKDYSIDEIDEEIVPVVEKITGDHNIQTQKVSGTKQVIIKTKTLSLAKREQVNKALKTTFGVKESDITAENISSTISGEMRRDAVIAVIVATIFMLLYIWFRFKDVRFAYKCGCGTVT